MAESDGAASSVRPTEVRRARYSGRWRVAELLWLLVPVLGWWSGGLALGWLLLMVALIAQLLPVRVGPTALARLPAAATVLVAAVSALGLIAGFLAIPWLSSRALAAGSAVAACLGLAVAVGVRRSQRRSEAAAGSADWYLPWIPLAATFALVAAARLRTLSSPSSSITWSQMSGDDFSHLSLSVFTMHSGGLDYSQYPYPRGLHTVVGWAFAAFGPSEPSQMLNGWTRLWSSFELFNFGLLMVAMAVAVLTALRTLAAPKFAGAAAMIVLLVAGFTGPIFGFTVGRGFATTIAGGWMLLSVVPLGLAAPPNEAVRAADKSAIVALVGSSVIVAALANTWLLIAVAPALMCVWWLWRTLRAGLKVHSIGVWVAAVATVVTCALTAFMPVWILAAQGGTDQISEAAPIDTVSPWLLAGCLTAMAVIIALAVKSNHALPPWAPDWVLQVLACLATCAVMIIATSSSWADMLYYPRKMEWFAMALSLPALVALVGLGVGTLLAAADVRGRHTLAATAVTLVVVVVGVAALAAVLKPAAVRSNLSAVRRVASPAPPRWWDVAVRPELLTVLNSGGTAIAWRFGNHSATAQTNRVISVWPQSQTPIEALMGAMPGSSPVMCRYLEDHRATVVLFTSGPRLAAAAAQGGCTPTTNAAVPRAMKSPVRR